MKIKERKQALSLRIKGLSLGDISRALKVSKGSVSLWVKGIKISDSKRKLIQAKNTSFETIEKRRQSRLKNEENKRSKKVLEAKEYVSQISKKELLYIGAMLYFAEGGKTQRGLVRFSNSDPRMIQIMMKFFRVICKVTEDKFRGHIHVHNFSQVEESIEYWQKITGISSKQFFKSYFRNKNISVNEKPKGNNLRYGTFDIYVCDTNLFLKIKGWIEGIYENIASQNFDK